MNSPGIETVIKDWIISYAPKPIPDHRHDWDAVHKDFDGAPDSGDIRCFTAESREECIRVIYEEYCNL